jgi:hypothetical protein
LSQFKLELLIELVSAYLPFAREAGRDFLRSNGFILKNFINFVILFSNGWEGISWRSGGIEGRSGATISKRI